MIARPDLRAGDLGPALDDADDRAGQVERAGGVEVGHVGGFAAEQGDAAFTASAGYAGDHGHLVILGEFVRGQVIEEEERLRAGGEDVVDAVVDQIAADPAEPSRERGEHDFGANPVGRGDQDGVVPAREVEEAAEGADAAELFGPDGRLGQLPVAGD